MQVRHREFKGLVQIYVLIDTGAKPALELGPSDIRYYIYSLHYALSKPMLPLRFRVTDPNLYLLISKIIIIVQAIPAISHL